MIVHTVKGLPLYPGAQLQIGLWLTTIHFVFNPHGLGQGLIHLWSLHASWDGQSELTTHSGRQPGGLPTYVGKQEHTGCPDTSLHWLLGPQGDGEQTFLSSVIAKK